MAKYKIDRGSEPTMMNWTIEKLVGKMDDKEVDFDIDIQRKYVWKDNEQKSLLVQSAILNDFIPPLYFNKTDGKYDGIDGKQRAITFCEFLNDKFALEGLGLIPTKDEDGNEGGIDINGMLFSELPEVVQKVIREANIIISIKDEMDWERAHAILHTDDVCVDSSWMNKYKKILKLQKRKRKNFLKYLIGCIMFMVWLRIKLQREGCTKRRIL